MSAEQKSLGDRVREGDWQALRELEAELARVERENEDLLRSMTEATIRHGIAISYLKRFAPKAHEMFLNEPLVKAFHAKHE